MALADFKNLPFALQLSLLLRDGSMLLCRIVGREQQVLFSLQSYYVEVGWDGAGHIKFIRSFKGTKGLDPYLSQLDWLTLV
ncbi:MAG TPA: hypothetical protein VK404_11990 [Spirosoma sp.]|jgi:hypothetical protein|nr:hypothetical protein [Spirosoma sp.]